MKVQIIEKDGREMFAVVPIEAWRELLEKAEMLEDVAAYDRAETALAGGEEELVPQELVDRLVAGEHPVKVWREYRGLTQRDLAERSGLRQSYVAQIERGHRRGTVDAYRRLAETLGVEIDDLVH